MNTLAEAIGAAARDFYAAEEDGRARTDWFWWMVKRDEARRNQAGDVVLGDDRHGGAE